MTVLSYFGNNLGFAGQFRDSMTEYNKLFMKEILRMYKGFEGVETLVDMGDGDGSILGLICSTYPSIKGINYDIVSVIEKSPEFSTFPEICSQGKPSSSSWSDDQRVQILKNSYDALPEGGKAIVVSLVIRESPKVDGGVQSLFQMYLYMKSMNPTEKERMKEEFDFLGKQAGFSHIRVAARANNFSLIELYKN